MERKKKMRIKLKAYDSSIIDLATSKIMEVAKNFNCKVSGPIPLPTNREVVTIIRSPHKHKDSREQFEIRTHKRLIDIFNPSQKAIDSFNQLDLPLGVDINIIL